MGDEKTESTGPPRDIRVGEAFLTPSPQRVRSQKTPTSEITEFLGKFFASYENVDTDMFTRWLVQQWKRYDTLVGKYATLDNDTAKKALCLAFVRSILDDRAAERVFTQALFRVTESITSDCTDVVGRENVCKTKSQLLFVMWLLPRRAWQQAVFRAFRDYWCRGVVRSTVPFRNALGSVLRVLATRMTDPIADVIEPFL